MRRRLFVTINRTLNAVITRLKPRRFRGADLLLLTTTGRRSGKQRTTPLICLDDADAGRWVVVASNGGADWEPGWWLNLQAGGTGTVEIAGERTVVGGAELEGPERAEVWQRLLADVFDYEQYQRDVTRRLAVVALTRVER